MAEIVMPRLSDTMEEGTILRWLKRDGEHVARGEQLVEIETDKAAMVYESDEDGVLQVVAGEGDTLAVGATIAQVGAAGNSERARSASGDTAESQAAEEAQHGGTTAEIARPPGPQPGATETAAPPPARAKPTASTAGAHADAHDGERVKASPVARRVAQERGVDLHRVAGSGPHGRIVKADVEGAASGAETTLAERVATAKGETTIVELTRTQRTIARRMAESKATIPDFALQMEIDMEACVALRAELKRLAPEEAPTYNDMIVKAGALALREHPRANGGYRDGKLQLHSRVNVGVAVATDDALVVPTVFDADQKSLGEIARETRTLAARVRAGTITPPELGGGTFTVSNLGMYGVRSFTAIVNPPQAAILSVGALAPRAVVVADEVLARHTLTVTLACDHRILYGADAARFLARIRALLEEPAALTL
ncbi:MAG TPA: dihydrolipoamide acetyltransferase family protein [Solirubrobacteraceae bacterium]|jgi:pyruvate dehydrogenase E2 component (dihydrolipoamide acetyltransferase)|nr:dihydrolipoamide acetyltransferase family protein [Solirubrobacteraceae bacterium]